MTASKFLAASFGLSLALGAVLTPSAASAMPASAGLSSVAVPDATNVQQVQWRRYGYGPRYGYYGGYRRSNGAAVAAGVIGGLALGAAIAGAAAAPPPPVAYAPAYAPPPGDWYAYCASKYRSFDPASGTYLGYDGLRHPCQ